MSRFGTAGVPERDDPGGSTGTPGSLRRPRGSPPGAPQGAGPQNMTFSRSMIRVKRRSASLGVMVNPATWNSSLRKPVTPML